MHTSLCGQKHIHSRNWLMWLQSSSPSHSKNRGCQAKAPVTPTLKKKEKGRLRELQASKPVAVPGKIKKQILLKEYQGIPETRMWFGETASTASTRADHIWTIWWPSKMGWQHQWPRAIDVIYLHSYKASDTVPNHILLPNLERCEFEGWTIW